MDNNILDNDDPVSLMVRAIDQSPIIPNQQQQQPQQSTAHASPHAAGQSTSAASASASASSTPLVVPGSTGPAASVEFLDAEAETALFLDSMTSATSNSLSLASPLPLPLPWSPSQDMIWTEDEILAGGGAGGGGGEVDGADEGAVVGMTLDDDLSGAGAMDLVATQEMDDAAAIGGGVGRAVLMDEDDEILPVVVIETVISPPQPVSPIIGFGSNHRLQQQLQQQQQQGGGVRFNSPQQNSGGGLHNLNRVRSFGKGDHHIPLRTAVGFGAAAAAQRSGLEKGRLPSTSGSSDSQPRTEGAEVGGGGEGGGESAAATITVIPPAEEDEEKPSDMEVDAPEAMAITDSETGMGVELVKDIQSTSLRELQEPVQPSSPDTTASSVLAPALEPTSTAATSSTSTISDAETATIERGTESKAGTATESRLTEPAAADTVRTEQTTESETTTMTDEQTQLSIDDPNQITVTSTTATGSTPPLSPPHSPSSSSPPATTYPSSSTKPPSKKRQRSAREPIPVPVHHHASWHSAPGSDIAFLSEMKASDADLYRFRREHEWLEERVRRPKRDHASDQLLDKALGLTRMVVVPSPSSSKGNHPHQQQKQRHPGQKSGQASPTREDKDNEKDKEDKESKEDNKEGEDETSQQHVVSKQRSSEALDTKDGEENDKKRTSAVADAATSIIPNNSKYIAPVRLSTGSRLAFSILKTNLSTELEEQARLETDQHILQQIIHRTATQLSTTAHLHQKAEERVQELQSKQPEQEKELQKLEKLERACLELRDRQRKQAEEEIRQLEETVRLLEQGRMERGKEDLRRAERQRVEMDQVFSAAAAH
ncbi:hypothetical protein BGX24_004752 [Mortierella sp. AD032]|nr:hypothetical protein BGX24_004752 [Mortierella sp. AD032]